MKIIENNIIVEIDSVSPNDYNPKPDYNTTEELKNEFEKIKNSLKYHGQEDPILVRKIPNGYEIINGYHRWRAMKELGFKKIEVKNLGEVSRTEAIKKTLSHEEIRIPIDVIEAAKLVKEIKDLEESFEGLPYLEEELKKKLELLDFDFDNFNEIDLLEDENAEEIKKLDKKKRYYFTFANNEVFNSVIDKFSQNGKYKLDTDKLLNLINNNNGEDTL